MRVLYVCVKKWVILRNYLFNDYFFYWDYRSGVFDVFKVYNFVLCYNNIIILNGVIFVGGCNLYIINIGIIINLN